MHCNKTRAKSGFMKSHIIMLNLYIKYMSIGDEFLLRYQFDILRRKYLKLAIYLCIIATL